MGLLQSKKERNAKHEVEVGGTEDNLQGISDFYQNLLLVIDSKPIFRSLIFTLNMEVKYSVANPKNVSNPAHHEGQDTAPRLSSEALSIIMRFLDCSKLCHFQ